MREHGDLRNAGIDHARERKIDKPETGAERHRRQSSGLRSEDSISSDS